VLNHVHKKDKKNHVIVFCTVLIPYLTLFICRPSDFTVSKDAEIEPGDRCNMTAKTLLTTCSHINLPKRLPFFFVIFFLIYASLVADSDPGIVASCGFFREKCEFGYRSLSFHVKLS